MGHEIDAAILDGFQKIGHYKMPVITQQGRLLSNVDKMKWEVRERTLAEKNRPMNC